MSLRVKKQDKNAERTFEINNIPVEFRVGNETKHGHIGVEYLVLPENEFNEIRNKGDYTLGRRIVRRVTGIGTDDDPWTDEEQMEFALLQPEILSSIVQKYLHETKTKHYQRGN